MKSKIFLGGTCNNSTWRDLSKPAIQNEHNALSDVRWNKQLYEFITNL